MPVSDLAQWSGMPAVQCALSFKKLNISPVVMSAGELESGNAGEPAKLIRQRYREVSCAAISSATKLSKVG